MRKVLSTEIPNTIDGEHKKAAKHASIVDPADVVFADGPESWTRDGREDIPVSSTIAASLVLAFDTDHRSDGQRGSWYEGDSRVEGKRVKSRIEGNPVVWGSLSSVQLTVMGTNEKPVLVVTASGRQTAKASEWLTGFLKRCRAALVAAKGDAKVAHGAMLMEDDPVARGFCQAQWLRIFFGSGSKLGKPLVGQTYSAAFHMSVSYTSDLPTERRALEKSKLANLQEPSPLSVEAETVYRLVRSYMCETEPSYRLTREEAFEHVRTFVRPLMAVGTANRTDDYVQRLYRLACLIPEAQQRIDREPDPRKMLALFEKYTSLTGTVDVRGKDGEIVHDKNGVVKTREVEGFGLFVEGEETVTIGTDEVVVPCNAATREDQLAILNPPPRERAERKKKTPTAAPTVDTAVLERLSALQSPMGKLAADPQKRAEIAAVAAWEAHRAGKPDALRDFPHLAEAIAPKEELPTEDDETPLSIALDVAEHWNGDPKRLEFPEFCEKQPKQGKLTEEQYEGPIKLWALRKAAHEKKIAEAKALFDKALAAMPATVKKDARGAWTHEYMEEMKG